MTFRFSLLLLSGLLALDLATETSVNAQDASPLAPPAVQSSTDVAYPDGATGDAVIDLELVVEADGAVSTAVVLDGVEPFAGEAPRHRRPAIAKAGRFAPSRPLSWFGSRVDVDRVVAPNLSVATSTISRRWRLIHH
jgi:hypothetical protein